MTDVLIVKLINDHPELAARTLAKLDQKELSDFMSTLPASLAAKAFLFMEPLSGSACLAAMPKELAVALAAELPLSLLSRLLLRLNSSERKAIISSLPQRIAISLRLIMSYPIGVVGSHIDPMVFTVREGTTIDELKKLTRKQRVELLHWIFVLGEDHKLVGAVDTRDLFLASGKSSIDAILLRDVVTLSDQASIPSVVRHPGWNSTDVLPVVDRKSLFLGVLRRQALPAAGDSSTDYSENNSPVEMLLELTDLVWSLTAANGKDKEAGVAVKSKSS